MKTARFSSTGGAIVANVSCTPAHDGSYTLMLWEKGKNLVVEEWKGNFVNTDVDSYSLDPPNSRHDGRHFECIATISVPAGVGAATVTLAVSQDGHTLERDTASVPPNSPGGTVDLFVRLQQV